MSDRNFLLLSVKPRFVDLIVDGLKTVELRRVRPRVKAGCTVIIYSTSPVCSVVATCRVQGVLSDSRDRLWSAVGDQASVPYQLFDEYFKGKTIGHAISLADVFPLESPLGLEELREKWSGFRPPQSYRYIPSDKIDIFRQKANCSP